MQRIYAFKETPLKCKMILGIKLTIYEPRIQNKHCPNRAKLTKTVSSLLRNHHIILVKPLWTNPQNGYSRLVWLKMLCWSKRIEAKSLSTSYVTARSLCHLFSFHEMSSFRFFPTNPATINPSLHWPLEMMHCVSENTNTFLFLTFVTCQLQVNLELNWTLITSIQSSEIK